MINLNPSNKPYLIIKLSEFYKDFFENKWSHKILSDDKKVKIVSKLSNLKEENDNSYIDLAKQIYSILDGKNFDIKTKQNLFDFYSSTFEELKDFLLLTETINENFQGKLSLNKKLQFDLNDNSLEKNVKNILEDKWSSLDVESRQVGLDLVNSYLTENFIKLNLEESYRESFFNILKDKVIGSLYSLNNSNPKPTLDFLESLGLVIEEDDKYQVNMNVLGVDLNV